jgi:hypothetical protein
MTGNESELIRRYRGNHPAFPHQTTLDQFFDEEQFEAYRQLGVHVAEGLFSRSLMDRQPDPKSMLEWFTRLARNLLETKASEPGAPTEPARPEGATRGGCRQLRLASDVTQPVDRCSSAPLPRKESPCSQRSARTRGAACKNLLASAR